MEEVNSSYLDSVLSLHKSNIKIPYEHLNKMYRLIQRELEIQTANFQSILNKERTNEDTLLKIKNHLLKLRSMLVKYKNDIQAITAHSHHILKNIEPTSNGIQSINTSVNPMPINEMGNLSINIGEIFNSHLMHYFFENFYLDTAQCFAKTVWSNPGIENEWFQKSNDILGSIRSHDMTKASKWMVENKNRLIKIDSRLEFLLQRQEFLKYIYDNRLGEAITYAKKWPKKQIYTNDSLKTEIKTSELPKLLGLLVYAPTHDHNEVDICSNPRYSDFLDCNKMWKEVLSQFHSDNLAIYAYKNPSDLKILLTFGIAAIKSTMCTVDKETTSHCDIRSDNCPICSSDLKHFADRIPSINWLNTKLYCSGSRVLIDDNNPGLISPAGFLYSKSYLDANGTDVSYNCPMSSKVFKKAEFKRLYMM